MPELFINGLLHLGVMTVGIDWNNLRPLNKSEQETFEELCCQLAFYEQVPDGSKFERKGKPDGGVECFWKFPNGDEWCWQAKFFLNSPSAGQWGQIDESVRTLLNSHPAMLRCTVALPVDLPDSRIKEQDSAKDKWDKHVKKWQKWGASQGRKIEFEYWGEHQFWERLARQEHHGRYFFWFHKEFFSPDWFQKRLAVAIQNAGERYTPKSNVELPITYLFDGLGRTLAFFNRIQMLYGKLKKAYDYTRSDTFPDQVEEKHQALCSHVGQILNVLAVIDKAEAETELDWKTVVQLVHQSLENAWACHETVQQARQKLSKDREKYDYRLYHLRELISALRDVEGFGQSNEAQLANTSGLLLVGEAGKGKTHLFCDIAEQRTNAGLPTILLLGQHFVQGNPWAQIYRELGLSGIGNENEFLGALEAAAQLRGAKAMILIDALNEGEGAKIWRNYLPGILQTLSHHPWISLAVSVRSNYEKLIIPDHLTSDKLVRIAHHGFEGHEYQAMRIFFDSYRIEQPSIPPLSPEFQTPLFLKIFCEGLEKKGLTKIPLGLQGITAVFNFFIQAIQDKLEREFDISPRYVEKAITLLIKSLASRGVSWLPLEESEDIVNSLMPHRSEKQMQSLHYLLVAEGLLAKDAFLTDRYDWVEGIRFAYERLSDHQIVKFLLSTHLQDTSVKSFPSIPQLATLVTDERACYRHSGLIEALSIQLPELKGLELVQIFPDIADYLPVRQSFLESLLWRKPQTIGEPAKEYINQYVLKHQDTLEQFLNVLLTVAVNPDHPYNADFLHKHLMRFEMAERDEWWSIFLHEQYDTQNAVDRLIDWAWSPEDKSHIADESVRLCGVALAWFLTTSNRFVRDRATKALVNLFTERIPVLCQLLPVFVEVNDLYVLERLMAVAYGCAMRSKNDQHNTMLAQKVYKCIFANDDPPPNILLRDYARGVIESALYKQCELQVDTKRVRPLYKSLWPTYVPEKEELQKLNDQSRGMADTSVSLRTLYSSIMGDGFGDFGIYIIGGPFPWFSRRLGQPRDLSHKEIFEEFLDSLTSEQKEAWDQYQHVKQENLEIIIKYINNLSSEEREELANTLEIEQDFEEPDREVIQEKLVFVELLDRHQREIYEGKVTPYLENPAAFSNEFLFDLGLAKRWIFQKTLDFGWTIERFGEFDRNVNRYSFYGRGTRKPERIGKKYQWLAYHEFLARVSDNFEFKGDYWSDKKEAYNGPWQISSVRDIDPSCLLRKTPQDISWQSHRTSWWAKLKYEDWEVEPDEVTWLKGTGDLPDVTALIAPVNQKDGSAWLTLEANYRWTQASPVWDDSYSIPRKDIEYWLQSYIVKKSDIEELFDWAVRENFYGKMLPDSHQLTRVFLGEFFWSPAFAYHNIPYYHHDGWIGGEVGDIFPKKVLVSTDQYLQEDAGYDCSIDEGIHIYLPCQWIVEQMKLSWNGVEGHFFDDRGKLIAFDPSITTPGPGALLINREAFRSFLDEMVMMFCG